MPMTTLARWKAEQARAWGSAPWQNFADSVLAPLHAELVGRLAPQAGERWLDLATGTGAVALRASHAGARVTAQDLAPALVVTARRLAAEQGLAIQFDLGDAERLPYPRASFDIVSSAQGVIFAADHAAVAREIARVCRPGGRLGLTCWLPNPGLDELMDRIPVERPAAADRPRDWGRPGYVRDLLEADFDLEFAEAVCPWRAASGEAAWLRMITSDGVAQAGVAALAPRERDALHRNWVKYFEGHRGDGEASVPRPYVLIVGRRRSDRSVDGRSRPRSNPDTATEHARKHRPRECRLPPSRPKRSFDIVASAMRESPAYPQ